MRTLPSPNFTEPSKRCSACPIRASPSPNAEWRPQVDIYETRDEIVIQAEIAGVRQEEILLEISPAVVKISGTRGGGAREEEARYRLAEIPCGDFERTLQLPALIDTGTAAAVYQNGLLEIRLAKRPLNRIHKINVQHG